MFDLPKQLFIFFSLRIMPVLGNILALISIITIINVHKITLLPYFKSTRDFCDKFLLKSSKSLKLLKLKEVSNDDLFVKKPNLRDFIINGLLIYSKDKKEHIRFMSSYSTSRLKIFFLSILTSFYFVLGILYSAMIVLFLPAAMASSIIKLNDIEYKIPIIITLLGLYVLSMLQKILFFLINSKKIDLYILYANFNFTQAAISSLFTLIFSTGLQNLVLSSNKFLGLETCIICSSFILIKEYIELLVDYIAVRIYGFSTKHTFLA